MVGDVKQTEINISKPLVPGTSRLEAGKATANLKKVLIAAQ
jgi:hypothetical protein